MRDRGRVLSRGHRRGVALPPGALRSHVRTHRAARIEAVANLAREGFD